MEKTVVIACSMLKKEIEYVMKNNNISFPVVWIDKGLHAVPKKLKNELQKRIDENQDVQNIILCFGLCGNATQGLVSQNTKLKIMNYDDCVRMFYLANTPDNKVRTDCLFLSPAWFDEDSDFLKFDSLFEKYGEKKAKRILDIMYANYKDIKLTVSEADTMEDISKAEKQAKEKAELLKLEFSSEKVTLRALEDLLTGKNSSSVLEFDKGEKIVFDIYK